MEDGFHGGGSVVGGCQACAAILLEAAHKPAVCGQLHLKMGQSRITVPDFLFLFGLKSEVKGNGRPHLPSQSRHKVLVGLAARAV